MTIDELINKLSELSGDEKKGAVDALNRILQGKMGGGDMPGMPLPPEIDMPVDPDLEDPEDDPTPGVDPEDIDIDDPDDLLKKSDGDKDSDKSDQEESDNKDGKDDSGKSSDTPDEAAEDTSNKEPGDPTDDTDSESEEDEYEEDDGDSGEGALTDDERDKKDAADAKSKRTTINRVLKAANKALDKSDIDSEKRETLEKAKAELEKIADLSDEELKDIDQDKFDSIVNSTLDAINEVAPVSYTRDLKDRVDEIAAENDDVISRQELDREDTANYRVDPAYQKKKAAEAEKEKYKPGPVNSLEKFKFDFSKAIADQVDEYEAIENEMNMEDERHAESGIYQQRTRIEDELIKEIPTIDVYFDQSGSWGTSEVEEGMNAISVINQYTGMDPKTGIIDPKEQKIKLNIYYFSKILSQSQSAARSEPSQECWDLVVDNILAAPKTKNVVIVTDRDIAYNYGTAGHHGCIDGPHTEVEGHVWWIWKNAWSQVPEARRALHGRMGTSEYALRS